MLIKTYPSQVFKKKRWLNKYKYKYIYLFIDSTFLYREKVKDMQGSVHGVEGISTVDVTRGTDQNKGHEDYLGIAGNLWVGE